MYINYFQPKEVYKKYIDSFFTIDTNLISKHTVDLIVPDGTFGLLFIESNNSIKRNCLNQQIPTRINTTKFFGQKTKPIEYHYFSGCTKVFGVKITPIGFPFFSKVNAKELKDLTLDIDQLEQKNITTLNNTVLESKLIEDKIKNVEFFLEKNIINFNFSDDYLIFESIVYYMLKKRGEVRFDDLTNYFNLNYKKIERLFDSYLGMNPKKFMRIVRFNACISIFKKDESNQYNFTQLGNEVGYFDQSHFIRDFKSFAHLAPRQFFNREVSYSEEKHINAIANRDMLYS